MYYTTFDMISDALSDMFNGVDTLFRKNYITTVDPSHIEIELPGVKKDEVSVEHTTENGYTRLDVSYKGRREGKRKFVFPTEGWDVDKTEAILENGLLTIKVPKVEKPSKKKVSRIEVT